MKKSALITGITGQDGSYLAELLLEKGYNVHGLIRRSSSLNTDRICHLIGNEAYKERFFLHEGDLTDASSIKRAIEKARPQEIYNLGAMSHVKTSFDLPEYTMQVDAFGVLTLLEILRNSKTRIKLYQASTSELFGKVQEIPQKETTPFYPRSPYGVAKLCAYWLIVNYREAYNLFACNGILFNHESPRRGETFVSKKITRAVSRIKYGLQETLVLGNLDAQRDWGYAKDFVKGMWLMLQQEIPDDYILATGVTTSVRRFVELSFAYVNIDLVWKGSKENEVGVDSATGKILVRVSSDYFRPTEVDLLIGDPSKARTQIGWQTETSVEELVKVMMAADVEVVSESKIPLTCS